MTSPRGTLSVCRRDQTVIVRVEGQATMHQSLPLRRLAEEALARGTAVRLDLRCCTYMDSTFMGTLLALRRCIERRKQGELALVCPSAQCSRLLQQIGLDELFPVVTAEEPTTEVWTEVALGAEDAATFTGNVVQAHRELADLPGPAAEPFREVVRCLERDAQANKPQ